MAKANWVKVTPSSGSLDAFVDVSSTSEHTGRKVRTSILTWRAENVKDVVRNVAQAGKPENVRYDSNAASADKGGQQVTISGVSNSSRLTFRLGTGDLNVQLPTSYIANSISTPNGSNISGDPGAQAEFPFSITFDVPANEGLTALDRQIIVEDAAGHKTICLLKSAAGDAFIIIAEGDIELDYLGTPVSVFVDSNTSWTVE